MSRQLIVSCTIALAFVLAGCAAAGRPDARGDGLVPGEAKLAASGKPTIAHFKPGGATLYVVDETTKSLIFSGQIPADAQVVIRVDREASAVVAQASESEEGGDAMVLAKPIDKNHRFSMWTVGDRATGAKPTTRSIEISE